jgi:hypothetical protein
VKLGARGLRVVFAGQFLNHSLTAKVVDQRGILGSEAPANDGQILSHGSVVKKLSNERFAVGLRFGEQEDAGGEAVDAVYDQGTLALPL